jgi:predicted HTH transcriptional regulator
MLLPLDVVEKQVSKTDQQLMLHLIMEQKETNRLLTQLLGQSASAGPGSIDELKRPEIMKRVSELPEKPQGWQKWGTEEMRKLLKEAV